MSLITVGSVAFDAIETPFGKTDKIIGGAGTYIALSSSYFTADQKIVSVVGEDFPTATLDDLRSRGCDVEGIQIKEGEIVRRESWVPYNLFLDQDGTIWSATYDERSGDNFIQTLGTFANFIWSQRNMFCISQV